MTRRSRTLVIVSKKRRKLFMKSSASPLHSSVQGVVGTWLPPQKHLLGKGINRGTSDFANNSNMAFVPVRISRPQVLPPVLCSRRFYLHLLMLIVISTFILVIWLISQIKVTFVHLHMESDTDLERVTLPRSFSQPRGAYCLDGSPPAYYIRHSPVVSVKYWIVYLPGGAWCTSPEDCYTRSQAARGSSFEAKTSESYSGIMSRDCQINPDFCLWNVVAFLYCDGGSFLGNASMPVKHNGHSLYMRGAVIFDTLLEYLSQTTSFGDAEQVVLAGSSAGGTGALIHVDRLRSMLPNTVQTVHVIVDAAMFVDTPGIDGEHAMAKIFQNTYDIHALNASAPVTECRQTMSSDSEWRCLFPGTYHKFVFTPMFFTNSIYDSWQRYHVVKITCRASDCPNSNIDVLYENRDAVRALAAEIAGSSKKNGVYLTWCPVHIMTIRPWLTSTVLGSPNMQTMLTAWLLHDETMNSSDVLLDIQPAVEQCSAVLS